GRPGDDRQRHAAQVHDARRRRGPGRGGGTGVIASAGAGGDGDGGHDQRRGPPRHRIGRAVTVAVVRPPSHSTATSVSGSTARLTTASATGPSTGERPTEVTSPTACPSPPSTVAPRGTPSSARRRPRIGRGTLPPRLSMRATSSWPV